MPTERERLKQMAPSALDRARSLDAGYAPQPEAPFSARAYTTAFDAFGGNNPERRQQAIRAANLLTGEGARTALDFVPFIGDALALSDAIKMAEQGNMLGAAGLGTLAAIGLVPVAGDVVKKGGDLAMDTASRMRRAADQGFLPETVYHGTAKEVGEFAPNSYGGSVTKSKSAKMGVWLSDNPEVSGSYAKYAAEDVPVRDILDQADRAGRARNFAEQERLMLLAENLELGGSLRNAGGQNLIPARVRGNLMEIDVDGATMSDLSESQLYEWAKEAKEKNFDGLKILNFSDNADYGNYLPATHYLIFDPSNIRSVNAAFDPVKTGSSNLLAGGAAAAVGAGALTRQQQEERQRSRPD
jgi:hypothetical protein